MAKPLALLMAALLLGPTITACDDPDPDPPGMETCCLGDAGVPDGPAADLPSADSASPDAPASDLPPTDTSGDSAPGDSAPGDSAPGDSAPGDSAPGDSAVADVISKTDGSAFKPGGSELEIVKSCIKLAACNKVWTASECLAMAYGSGLAVAPYMSCVGKGTAGCGDFTTCLNITYAKPTCTATSYTCVGNKSVVCSPAAGIEATTDCPKMFGAGTSCLTTGSSFYPAGCSAGATCTGSTLSMHCSGNKMAICINGKELFLANCPLSGLTCRDGACAGPDEACTGTTAKCEAGGVIAFCSGDYRLRMACGALGASFSCQPSTKTGARCQKATQCDPDTAKGQELCTGTKLTVCNAGELLQVDCKALGFTGCASGNCTF